MEMTVPAKTVELIGVTESKAMTIAASGKVFYTLISGLYSRKIESICREIVSNARDGHAKRGNTDRPFFVHAPTRWEPWFSVRDYGASIDHETVMEYCSQMGWSSKEKSNLEVGTFGYGMKSPFAYTSQFTLSCILNGEKRIYSYHIDENGIPQIVLRETWVTEEEQGVEVRFDAKTQDIDAFHTAIRWVGLPYYPCFESNLDDVRSAQIVRDDNLFFFTGDAKGPMVQIGPVWYKIDFDQLPDCKEFAHIFGDRSFVLRSSIGDIGITPSRESLEYTPKTVANLTKLLAAAYAKLQGQVSALLSTIPDVWTAASKWRAMRSSGPFYSLAKNTSTPWGTFGELANYAFDSAVSDYVNATRRIMTMTIKKRALTFYRDNNTAVYVFDAAKPGVSAPNRRIFAHMKANDIDEAVVINLPDPKSSVASKREHLMKAFADRKARKAALANTYEHAKTTREKLLKQIAEYGCPVVLYQDQLPEPEKLVYNREHSTITIYNNPYGKTKWSICRVEPVEDRLNIVFELDGHEFRPDIEPRKIKDLVKRYAGLNVGEIIGVPKSNFKKFLKLDPAWTSYKEVFSNDFFPVDELKERIKTFHDNELSDIDYIAGEANRLKWMIEDHLPTTPAPMERLYRAVENAERVQIRRKTILHKLIETGPSLDDTKFLLLLVTGEQIARPDTMGHPELAAAWHNVKAVYPRLNNYLRSDGEEAAIYIMGLTAMRAARAASFLDACEAA